MAHALLADPPVIAGSNPVPERGTASPADYKDAIARLPGGVSILACEAEDGPHGRLIGSLTSLSADPPRALVCVGKGSLTHDRLLEAKQVSIAILAEGDLTEAERFSKSDQRHERFSPDRWSRRPGRPPRYDPALARFVATVEQRLDFDSHSMLILRMEEAHHAPGRPAVTFDRKLHRLAAEHHE